MSSRYVLSQDSAHNCTSPQPMTSECASLPPCTLSQWVSACCLELSRSAWCTSTVASPTWSMLKERLWTTMTNRRCAIIAPGSLMLHIYVIKMIEGSSKSRLGNSWEPEADNSREVGCGGIGAGHWHYEDGCEPNSSTQNEFTTASIARMYPEPKTCHNLITHKLSRRIAANI